MIESKPAKNMTEQLLYEIIGKQDEIIESSKSFVHIAGESVPQIEKLKSELVFLKAELEKEKQTSDEKISNPKGIHRSQTNC